MLFECNGKWNFSRIGLFLLTIKKFSLGIITH